MGKASERHKLSTFKLNALLDITLAINDNVSTSELIRRFEKLLTDDLDIGKVMVLKLSDKWECLLNSGFGPDFFEHVDMERDLLPYEEISFITSEPQEFPELVEIVIPVPHKDKAIAFVLIGDIEEEGEGVSPIIKHLRFIQTLSNIITVAIENKRLFQQSLRQEALKREMELASHMQTMLIPEKDKLPSNAHIRMEAFYHPHFEVGGDYYDVVRLGEDEIGFCIADVSGKGISAAILMSNFQANVRALFKPENSLTDTLKGLNACVINSAKGEKFITFFIARYHYPSRTLSYVNAGHNPPLLYEPETKKLSQLTSGCVGMGMLDELPFVNEASIKLEQQAKLFCYTDGLVEVIKDSGVSFGTEDLEKELCNSDTLDQNIRTLIEKQQIMEGSTAIFDDISIIGAEFPGEQGF
ncbi:MAG: serine/threonine protein phosphatase [Bacteroidetes bacterium]|nr:MAG: serine/threonine protein phosphatase [Bacteroidota bacterium]